MYIKFIIIFVLKIISSLDPNNTFENFVYAIIEIWVNVPSKRNTKFIKFGMLKLFGKEPWEVEYGEKCPVCDVRIDEYGFCSCGSSGD